MVIESFNGKILFLDTAPLIYFIEGHSNYHQVLLKLFDYNDKSGFSFISSTITLLEVLVKPLKENQPEIVKKYSEILTTYSGIDIYELNYNVAIEAAKLRAKYNLRTPDSIQLATAIVYKADFFLTNDARLKTVSEINVISLSEIEL